MNEYILLMHDDAGDLTISKDSVRWQNYLTFLRQSGQFDGGSGIGTGECLKKDSGPSPEVSPVTGYVRVRAASLEDAKRFLSGNPVFDAGGTVEIRELPRSD